MSSSPPPLAPELGTSDVKVRAQRSIIALGLRTLGSLGLRVVSSLALSHLLFPGDYGAFAIVAFTAAMGAFLGDLGLSAALVRQQHEPTQDEISTSFWSHQAFTVCVVSVLLVLAPLLSRSYELGPSGTAMVSVMALGLFFHSLRVIPIMVLERQLHFPALARIELIEGIAQTASTILLAWLGLGAWALIGGGLVRGGLGMLMLWSAAGWRPRGKVRWTIVKRLLGFGIWFQLTGLIPAVLNGWIPLVVGRMEGKDAVGLVNWATALASVPLALSSVLTRVAYPAYSRLQADSAALADYLRTSIRRISALLCLVIPFGVIALPPFIPVVFGARWSLASTLVQWFTIEASMQAVQGLLFSQQHASGHARERMYVATLSSLLRFGLGTLAVMQWGIVGVGVSATAVTLTELWLTARLVARRAPELSRLEFEVMEPFLTVGALLALALGLSRLATGQGGLLVQALVAAGLLTALVLAREATRRGLSLLGELRALLQHVRARRAPP
ncbi:polysaccharide biosynthesis protein [Corallococcus sp. CA053C]|uniref:oligosaccharide flippase family protein n=1 Tax=Corallococcus sp. CA053C TaxID=2316732 RepID=UPI000EA2DDD1|nr:oligosaccharide flippase family protein [Corallococcus sp. CA053C]RKH12135.1 polysaccharide biosynthesis protein [Corallococcus sp. CA053C]